MYDKRRTRDTYPTIVARRGPGERSGHDPAVLGARERVEAVAGRLGRGLSELASDVRAAIEEAVPELRDDRPAGLLETMVEQNIETMLGMLAHDIDPHGVDAPSAALEHARRLAQQGVSTFALIRAYRVVTSRFLRRVIEDVVRHSRDDGSGQATLDMVDRVCSYIDNVVEQLQIAYAEARDEWLDPNAILRASVRSVLGERELDIATAQARLGSSYTLRQVHVALEIWVDHPAGGDSLERLRHAAAALARAAGSKDAPLFVPVDEVSACIWLPLGAGAAFEREALAPALAALPGIYAALGEPAASLAGFRRTHEQAMKAEAVALVRNPPLAHLTSYVDVASIAPLCDDLDATRAWVAETLGDLALDDDEHEILRETVRIFLTTGGSYVASAERLHLHRNSAHYRIRKAEQMRGRPFRDGRLDVELALLACHWLGPAILTPPETCHPERSA